MSFCTLFRAASTTVVSGACLHVMVLPLFLFDFLADVLVQNVLEGNSASIRVGKFHRLPQQTIYTCAFTLIPSQINTSVLFPSMFTSNFILIHRLISSDVLMIVRFFFNSMTMLVKMLLFWYDIISASLPRNDHHSDEENLFTSFLFIIKMMVPCTTTP